jgi:rubrerythrin
MDIHASGDLRGILDTLVHMKEIERIVSEFYVLCANTWPVDLQFWTELSREELEHENNITTMYRIVSNKPEHFEKGRPFNIFAVQTMITGIRNNIEKLKKGEIREDNAILIARDIEQSFIEFRYGEIVKTADIEYNTLVQKIVKETTQHKIKIDQKIRDQ